MSTTREKFRERRGMRRLARSIAAYTAAAKEYEAAVRLAADSVRRYESMLAVAAQKVGAHAE